MNIPKTTSKVPVPVKCPEHARRPDDIVGCGSSNVAGPDDEGFYDCLDCGLFFKVEFEKPEKPIRVRIAVAVSPEGAWNAGGYGLRGFDPADEDGFVDCALERVDTNQPERCQIRWIEAEIAPNSEPVVIGLERAA